jgi:outer membrane protein, heavy metal efflux system
MLMDRWSLRGLQLLVFVCALASARARAETPLLTRARVAELARAAPAARAAATEVSGARSAVAAAQVLSLDNPSISALGGLRFNPDGTRPFAAAAALSVPVPLGPQRGSRVEAAKAELRAAAATGEDAGRKVLLAALLQHALVLKDQRQLELLSVRRAIAQRLLVAAEKQRIAGAVPELDVALARLQAGREAAAESAAEGVREADRQALAAMLGVPPESAIPAGALVPEIDPPPLAALLHEVDARADIRAAALGLDAARARAARERAARWPTLSLQAQYERDEAANVGLVGLAIPLPIFNANAALVASSSADVEVASARLGAARSAAAGHVRELYARYLGTRRALDALRPTTALVSEAMNLATRGYELGENDLARVLLVRREVLDAQAALLDAEHAHANAKLELLVASGRAAR